MVPALKFAQKLWIFLLFLLVGPPLGALIFVPFLMHVDHGGLADPAGLVVGYAIFAIFSYPFGLLPAGLAGGLFLLVAPHLHNMPIYPARFRAFMVGALCGLLAAVVFSFIFNSFANTLGRADFKSQIIFFLIPGFVGGGICGQLSQRLLLNPSACPQLSRETINRWVFTVVLVAVFFGALMLVRDK